MRVLLMAFGVILCVALFTVKPIAGLIALALFLLFTLLLIAHNQGRLDRDEN